MVPVSMETLMNEKGPSNRGDGVNEELPHWPDTVCDGGWCLEIEFFITFAIIIILIIIIIIVIFVMYMRVLYVHYYL